MPSFGSSLRRTRERQGISLDEVARDTRLSKRYLLALEDESIHELPGGFYNRAYLRTYAAYLGLDSDSLVGDYEKEEAAQTDAGRLAVRPDVLATMRRVVARRQPEPAIGLGTVARVSGFAGLAIMLLVGLVWVGGRYFTRNNETRPVVPPARVVSGARGTLDPNAARPEPARLELRTASLGEVFPSPLAPEVPAADDARALRVSVSRSGVGTDVVDRQLVGLSDTFPVGTRVAFWTHVTGGRPGDTVHHVWFHEGRTAGAVDLAVGGPSWRTHSRRTLAPGAEGDWVVEVRDVEGRVLARHEFRCEQ